MTEEASLAFSAVSWATLMLRAKQAAALLDPDPSTAATTNPEGTEGPQEDPTAAPHVDRSAKRLQVAIDESVPIAMELLMCPTNFIGRITANQKV